jgi:hypothetical protein
LLFDPDGVPDSTPFDDTRLNPVGSPPAVLL